MNTREEIDAEGFPFPLEEHIKILGILMGDRMTMDAHFTTLLTRAQQRQGILSKLARSFGA